MKLRKTGAAPIRGRLEHHYIDKTDENKDGKPALAFLSCRGEQWIRLTPQARN